MGPATDFYKKFALDCSGNQVACDLILLNSSYVDVATLCKFSTALPKEAGVRRSGYQVKSRKLHKNFSTHKYKH